MVFPEIVQFMDANRAIAPSLHPGAAPERVPLDGPIETEGLATLRDLGFRFSMDGVTDLRMEPRDLGERGIRYVKVPSQFLLGDGATGADIHAADLSDLLGRFGISLIAEKIEVEAQVVDLLEYDVRFGQGYLFRSRAGAQRGAPRRRRNRPGAGRDRPTGRGGRWVERALRFDGSPATQLP